MGTFFDSRKFLRTPPFTNERVTAQPMETASEFDDAFGQAPLPPPQSPSDSRAQRPAVTKQPLDDLIREIDQMKPRPLPQKPGGVRNVLGNIVGVVSPRAGEAILLPGYQDELRSWDAQNDNLAQRAALHGRAYGAVAQANRANAEVSRSEAQDALRKKYERDAGIAGDFTLGDARFSRDGTMLAQNKKPVGEDDLEITPEYGKKLGLVPSADGKFRIPKTAISGMVTTARPQNKPSKIVEYEAVVRGANPDLDDDAVLAEVSKMLTNDRKNAEAFQQSQINRNNRPPRPYGSGAAPSSLDDIAQAVIDGKQDFHGLSATEKKSIRPLLTKRGWTEPKNYSPAEKATLSQLDRLDELHDQLEKQFPKGSNAPGTGVVIGRLPSPVISEEGQALRAVLGDMNSTVMMLRSGKAVTPTEMERIEKFLPKDTDSDSVVRQKLGNFRNALRTARTSVGAYAKGGKEGATAPAEDTVLMTNGTETRRVKKDMVETAKSRGYRVK